MGQVWIRILHQVITDVSPGLKNTQHLLNAIVLRILS